MHESIWAGFLIVFMFEAPPEADLILFAKTRSALVVMRSLNSNARGIFGLLIQEQLDGKKVGMTFSALYEVGLCLFWQGLSAMLGSQEEAGECQKVCHGICCLIR